MIPIQVPNRRLPQAPGGGITLRMLRAMRTRAFSDVFGLRLLYQRRVRRIGLAVVLGAVLLFRLYQFLRFSGVIQWGFDFSFYWRAGRHVLAGESVYAPFQLAGPYPPQGVDYEYLYPPFLAVVVAPLSAIFDDYRSANWVWAGLGAAILVLAVLLIARREALAAGFDRVLLVGAAFAFGPAVGELIIGNVHLLILGLLAGAWLAVRRDTPRGEIVAGALVGVAALIKVFPGLLIVWFLLSGRYRAAAAAVVAMAAIAVATLPVVGLGSWLDYPIVLLNLGPPVDERDVLAPTAWLSAFMAPAVARIVVTAAAMGVIVWVTRHRPVPVGFAVTVALSVLIAPALYPHYLAIMLLPLLLALRHAPSLAWIGLAWLLMNGFEPEALGDAVAIVSRVVPTIGALLVVVTLVWFGRERVGPRSLMT